MTEQELKENFPNASVSFLAINPHLCECGCGQVVNSRKGKYNRFIHNHQTNGKELVPRKICLICGKLFYAPPVQMRRGGGKFCSNECRVFNMAKHPTSYPQTQSRRGNGGKRSDLQDRYFRSSWEANYARYLNFLIAAGDITKWEFEVDTFEFPIKRGSRFYTPDFKVFMEDGTFEYHEVKGYMDQRSATKINRMRKNFPHFRVVLVDKDRYRAIANLFGKFISGWEGIRGKTCRND